MTLGILLITILAVFNEPAPANVLIALIILSIPAACQLCFFTPKLIQIVSEKCLPGVRLPIFLFTTTQPTTVHATEDT